MSQLLAQYPKQSVSSCKQSAKSLNSESISSIISLMYNENNNGPRREPSGTPDGTGAPNLIQLLILDGDVPRSANLGVYISQLIRFARVSSHVDDFNTRNKVLTTKLLRQGYRYHKLQNGLGSQILNIEKNGKSVV